MLVSELNNLIGTHITDRGSITNQHPSLAPSHPMIYNHDDGDDDDDDDDDNDNDNDLLIILTGFYLSQEDHLS